MKKRRKMSEIYRLKKGSYVRPAFVPKDVRRLVAFSLVQAFCRGFDYVTPPDRRDNPLDLMERSFPLAMWGYTFILFIGVLVFGKIQKRHYFVWLGHMALCGAYSVLFIALFIPMLDDPPWFDGMRSVSTLLLPIAFHLTCGIRMGVKPLRVGETKVREEQRVVAPLDG